LQINNKNKCSSLEKRKQATRHKLPISILLRVRINFLKKLFMDLSCFQKNFFLKSPYPSRKNGIHLQSCHLNAVYLPLVFYDDWVLRVRVRYEGLIFATMIFRYNFHFHPNASQSTEVEQSDHFTH
jgi:hypothetical protein